MKRRPATEHGTHDLTDLRVGIYARVSLDADDTGKSTTDQLSIGREWVRQHGAVVAGEYVEPGSRSASRFTQKVREEFERLVADIEAGKLDAIWFWEQSRSSRRLGVFAQLRDLCRNMGVLWVERDRVIDPNDNTDMLSAGFKALISEQESEMTSQRVTRGKKSSALAGRPAGKVPYGYTRLRNTHTGAWERDVPDVFDGNGRPVEDSPAYVVREIFERIAGGQSITSVRRDLNERGIRTRQGYRWDNSKVRYIATSPTYVGQRVYQIREHCDRTASHDRAAKAVLKGVEGAAPPLVDAETFFAVQRILTDPARRTTRFGARPSTQLLSAIACCGKCGGKLIRKKGPLRGGRPADVNWLYACRDRMCVGVYQPDLDAYAEQVMVAWLSDPDVATALTAGENSAAAKQARADAEQGRAELGQLYRDVKSGAVSATIATLNERRLQDAVAEAEDRVQAATLPPVLRGRLGPQATAGWKALDLETKRQMIRTVADIRVRPVGRQGNRQVPVQDRVEWDWLIGPDKSAHG